MAKRKRKPSAPPPHGDTGPDTAAQRAGTKVIRRVEKNGLVTVRRDRRHIIEIMAQGNRRRPASINRRQMAAGMEMVGLYEATLKSGSPAWTKIRVDSSPRPDDVTVSMIEAQWDLAAARKAVPRHCLAVVQAVCRDGRSIRPGLTASPDRAERLKAILREGFDALADHFKV